MKYCPNCNAEVVDTAKFCPKCGQQFAAVPVPIPVQQEQRQTNGSTEFAAESFDHTAEFEAQDISDNKVYALIIYLVGALGIIIALLASKESPYIRFHLRQGLKLIVASYLLLICGAILCWTIIVPVAAVIMSVVLFVIRIICFFQVCGGKAKEPAIIRDLKFMK